MNKAALAQKYKDLNKELPHDLSSVDKAKEKAAIKKDLSQVSELLDKYYTKPSVAEKCYTEMVNLLKQKIDVSKLLFIEPSAGAGAFLDVIKEPKKGFDIAPTKESLHLIVPHDFLVDDLSPYLLGHEKESIVFIGNPPFGVKGGLALSFLNQSFVYGEMVGFIVPLQFRKWSIQSKVLPTARMVLDLDLPESAFDFMGKDYAVRCCFQLWVTSSLFSDLADLRIKNKPPTTHPDFEMYQYNRTAVAEKYFDYDWDFAVPRQGYLDYSFKSFRKEDCNKKQQWIFFKAKNKKALEKLLKIDFVSLSKKNIGTPGFGKADVVDLYLKTGI